MIARFNLWRFIMVVPALAFGLTSVAQTAELNPAAVRFVKPDQFKWRDPENKGPNNGLTFQGDPSQPGFYVNLTKWNKGNNFSRPHFHPNDRFITVLNGTWWNGSGPAFDPANAVPMRAGTFVTHHAKGIHWDGAKDEDAVLLIVGEGPGTSTRAQETEGKFSGTLNPSFVSFKTPEQLTWRDPTGAAPINQAVLHGDPSKPGFYVLVNRYKPGAFSRPHFHANDGFVTVLKGKLMVGTGTKFDTNNMVTMPTGTLMQHFGKQVHFQGANDEEAMIVVLGQGPATATPAEEK